MDLQSNLPALGGGVLIGTSATFFLLSNGRIAGISNILAGLWTPAVNGLAWRLAFILGLLAGGWTLRAVHPEAFGPSPAGSWPVLAVAGFLVGFGARLANGCTSGHGVCGLSRRSWRSLAATLTFMATGMATVFVVRHLLQAAP